MAELAAAALGIPDRPRLVERAVEPRQQHEGAAGAGAGELGQLGVVGVGGELGQHRVEAALEEQRGVAEDRVGLHQPAGDLERPHVADAAERRHLRARACRP